MDDLSVCASVCPVHCRKTADRIRIPFGIIGRTGPGTRQIVGFGDPSTRRGTFGGEFVTNGDFTAYVFDNAATRLSSQITLAKLVTSAIVFAPPSSRSCCKAASFVSLPHSGFMFFFCGNSVISSVHL